MTLFLQTSIDYFEKRFLRFLSFSFSRSPARYITTTTKRLFESNDTCWLVNSSLNSSSFLCSFQPHVLIIHPVLFLQIFTLTHALEHTLYILLVLPSPLIITTPRSPPPYIYKNVPKETLIRHCVP